MRSFTAFRTTDMSGTGVPRSQQKTRVCYCRPMAGESRDLARTMMVLLFIGGLMTASFLVVRPFLPAVVWAATLVIATWPLMRAVQGALGGRRWPAVTVMTIALALVVLVP